MLKLALILIVIKTSFTLWKITFLDKNIYLKFRFCHIIFCWLLLINYFVFENIFRKQNGWQLLVIMLCMPLWTCLLNILIRSVKYWLKTCIHIWNGASNKTMNNWHAQAQTVSKILSFQTVSNSMRRYGEKLALACQKFSSLRFRTSKLL